MSVEPLPSAPRFSMRVRNWAKTYRFRSLYRGRDYLEAYAEHTDRRVAHNPQKAIGGDWERMGRLQFDFLVRSGLQPDHAMLDLGCGTLRGGRHFMRYLEPGNYTGVDISTKAIEYGRRLVEEEGLAEKQPRLVVSRNKNLRFDEFRGECFDYLLAQSVFTHLKPEQIEECFEHVGDLMHEGSAFFFTFYEGGRFEQEGPKRFRYRDSFFEAMAKRYQFALERARDYGHPKGQQMAKLTRLSGGSPSSAPTRSRRLHP